MTEASLRDQHRAQQDGVVGGHGGMMRCSCGESWPDPDEDCPRLEAALDELQHARMDDDGAPALTR